MNKEVKTSTILFAKINITIIVVYLIAMEILKTI